MSDRTRKRWRATVYRRPVKANFQWRHPNTADAHVLGQLMLEAYRDTIDVQHKTLSEAIRHVERFFDGEFGDPLLDVSFLAVRAGGPIGVTLASDFEGEPLLAQVYTAPDWKNNGVATTLIQMSMNALADRDLQVFNLVATAGNQPAEHVYTKLGFEPFEATD